jgi:hypothetical protein
MPGHECRLIILLPARAKIRHRCIIEITKLSCFSEVINIEGIATLFFFFFFFFSLRLDELVPAMADNQYHCRGRGGFAEELNCQLHLFPLQLLLTHAISLARFKAIVQWKD